MTTLEDREAELEIANEHFTLFDKLLYGGFGYSDSGFCFPTHIFKIIATIIFPPICFIFKHTTKEFPYIKIVDFINDINELIYMFVLTLLFYVPGLIYSLEVLKKCEKE